MTCQPAARIFLAVLLFFPLFSQGQSTQSIESAAPSAPLLRPQQLVPSSTDAPPSLSHLLLSPPTLPGLPQDMLLPAQPATLSAKSTSDTSYRLAAASSKENEALAPSFTGLQVAQPTGNDRTFTLTLQDPNGKADIRNIYLIFNDSLRASDSCFLFLQAQAKTLSLANDGATDWIAAPQPAGKDVALTNRSCSLNTVNLLFDPAGASTDANTVTIQFRVQFAESFAGTKPIFLFADDASGNARPWQQVSSITLNATAAPEVCCATVNRLASDAQTGEVELRFTLKHPALATDISRAYLIFNTSLAGANGCFLELDFRSRTVRLANDAATNWLPAQGQITFTGSTNADGLLANQQCELGSEAIGALPISDRQLLVRAQVRLKQWANTTTRHAYLFLENRTGAASQWQLLQSLTKQSNGSLSATPLPGGNPPVFAGDILTNPLTLNSAEFFTKFSDLDSAANLSRLYLLVNTNSSARNGCFVELNWKNRELRLADQSGTSWLLYTYQQPSLNIPGSTQLQNPNCAVGQQYYFYPDASTQRPTDGVVSSNLLLTTKPQFSGMRQVQAMAVDVDGNSSGWTQLATWDVPPDAPPALVEFAEPPTSQLARSFRFGVLDRNGPENLNYVDFVIGNSKSSYANACVVRVFPRAGTTRFQLANDAGMFTAELTLRSPANSPPTLSNSQCTLRAAGTAGPSEGVTTVFLDFVFASSFIGTFSVSAEAKNLDGRSSGWSDFKTITLTPPATNLSLAVTGALQTSFYKGEYDVVVTSAGFALSGNVLVDFMVGEGPTGTRNCWIQLSTSERLYRLNTDAGDTFAATTLPVNPSAPIISLPILSNARCSLLYGAIPNPALNGISVRFWPYIKPAMAGTNKVFVRATDRSNSVSSAWVQIATMDTPALPPQPTVTAQADAMVNNVKAVRTLYTTVTDFSGFSNYKNSYVIINKTLSNVGGCFLWLDYQNRVIRMAKDDGSSWLPQTYAFGYGSSNTSANLANGTCEIEASISFLGPRGASTGIQIKAGAKLAGLQKIFVYGETIDGRNTGWQQTAEADFGDIQSPSFTVSPDPVAGTTNRGQIRLTASSGVRQEDVIFMQLFFGNEVPSETTLTPGCRFIAHFQGLGMGVSDSTSGESTDLLPDGRRDIDSNQCRFLTTRSVFGNVPGTAAIQGLFDFELKDVQPTSYKVFARAGLRDGLLPWRQVGTWQTQNNPAPMGKRDPSFPLDVTGSVTSSLPITFDDPNGISDLKTGYFLIRSSTGTSDACFLEFDFINRQIRMANDSGQDWLSTSASFGSPATGVSNSQCTLVGTTVQTVAARNQLVLNLQMQFKPSFRGSKMPEVYVEDRAGGNLGWMRLRPLYIQ